METSIIFLLFLPAALGFFLLWKEGSLRQTQRLWASLALLAAAMVLRALLFPHETLDYQDFLARWVDYFRLEGFRGLSSSVGNYNLPYLYFLALFSAIPLPDLYLIKTLSVLFDVLLAWAALRLARVCHVGDWGQFAAFFLTLFLPTVVLNGAYWGQCDSIYGALALLSLAFVLEKRPVLSMVCITLSFSFKLQAVFLMPVFLVFLFTGHIQWKHLVLFPLTYLAVVLPAVCLGRPLADTLLFYFNQIGTVGSAMNYNSSSVFALIIVPEGQESGYSALGILMTEAFLLTVYIWAWYTRDRLNERALLGLALLICLGVPFLLPHMHDRYFFLSDVLSLALAVSAPLMAFEPALVGFGSFLGYYAYLNMRFLCPMRYGALSMVMALAACAVWTKGQIPPAVAAAKKQKALERPSPGV